MARYTGLLAFLNLAIVIVNGIQTQSPATEAPIVTSAPPVVADKYEVIAHLYSGNADNPTWFLSEEALRDVKSRLDGLFDHAGHGEHAGTVAVGKKGIADVLGFKGVEIRHFQNDVLRHTIELNKCEQERFQWQLFRNAPAGVVSDSSRKEILRALGECLRSKMASTQNTHAHSDHTH